MEIDTKEFLSQCERIMQSCEKSGFDESTSAMCCSTVIAALLPDCEDAHELIDATYAFRDKAKKDD